MSQILVRFGTRGIFDAIRTKKKPRKCITYKALTNEAEGTRTLNLRIDSPFVAFVSACQQRINNGKIKTYESGREPTETLQRAS